jgi:glyoxylase-like metal-dependent hydrolase (beta-lactamase superfamily II)
MKTLVLSFALLAFTLPLVAQPQREITNITGNLYRFRNAGHYSVFLVTPAGIIATDPINRDAAAWLKAELKTRFNQPVRFVIYSHSHADHASGGEVFADTATFVSHDLAKLAMVADKVPSPLADDSFQYRRTIELGGSSVELSYVGRNHGDGGILMRFPKERVLFAVDFIPVKSLGYRDFPGGFFPDWIESLKRVEAMDFDVLAPGHGSLGRKEDVRLHREYLEDLHAQVTKCVQGGMSVAEIKRVVDLRKYESWSGYQDMRELNIEGMHRIVTAPKS